MLLNWFDRISIKAFEITAFAILGLLFIARPTTLVPTVVLLLASIAVVTNAGFRQQFFEVLKTSQYRWIAYAMLAWFGVALFLAFIHQSQEKLYFPDNALRMVMSITLLAMTVRPSAYKWLLAGLIISGLVAAYWAVKAWPWSPLSRALATTNNPIHFGNLSAIVMMLSITGALLVPSISYKIRILLFVSGLGALLGAVSSLSRSSFIVIVCLLALVMLKSNPRLTRKLKIWLFIGAFTLCIVGVMSSTLRDRLRITEAYEDIQNIHDGNYGSSLGARVAMWKTAWLIFKENQFFGIGVGKFEAEIYRYIHAGDIPNTEVYNQPHSDIMHALSSGGLLKFFSYIGILVAPFIFFYRRYNDVRIAAEQRWGPIMGMQVVGAYFLMGLTNSNFDLQIYSTTYAVLVCVLAKLSMQSESAT